MKEMFGDKIDLGIFTTDSEEAREYNFRSSTNVLLDNELIPLAVSLDKQQMADFLREKLT